MSPVGPVEFIQSAELGSDPCISCRIETDAFDRVVGNITGDGRIYRPVCVVINGEPVVSPEPFSSLRIKSNGAHGIVRQWRIETRKIGKRLLRVAGVISQQQ